MPTTAERMGVAGNGYGAKVERALASLDLTRDEKLALAWALVDQASSMRTVREAQKAMAAIEDLYDAEEIDEDACPPTLPRISVAT